MAERTAKNEWIFVAECRKPIGLFFFARDHVIDKNTLQFRSYFLYHGESFESPSPNFFTKQTSQEGRTEATTFCYADSTLCIVSASYSGIDHKVSH